MHQSTVTVPWFPTGVPGPPPAAAPGTRPPVTTPRTAAAARRDEASSSTRSQSPPARRRALGPGTPHPVGGHVRRDAPPEAPGDVYLPDADEDADG